MAEVTLVAEWRRSFRHFRHSATCFRIFPLVVFFRKKFSPTESCAEDINSFWISSFLFCLLYNEELLLLFVFGVSKNVLQSYKTFCRCASVNRQSRTSTAETNCTTYYALFCLFCTTECAFLVFFFAQLNVHLTHACKKKIAHSEREWAIWVYGTLCSNGDQVAVMHATRE